MIKGECKYDHLFGNMHMPCQIVEIDTPEWEATGSKICFGFVNMDLPLKKRTLSFKSRNISVNK